MGKMLVTESELKKIIAESVKEIVNEDGYMWNPGVQQQPTGNTANVPEMTPNQQEKAETVRQRELYSQNQASNVAIQRWNSLGTAGQIKVIQGLVGATQDGKLGPQTLGKILMKVSGGQEIKTPAGSIYPQYLAGTNWNYGKPGTYQNRV